MKTIIIATDFSPAAKNAADYAAQLSKITSSQLILFHAWSIPAVAAESLSIPFTMDELEQAAIQALDNETERLEKTWNIKVEAKQNAGFASDELIICAEDDKADMVILGMGHRNKIGQVLGSVATSFLHKNKFPTLIIPEQITYSQPKTFLFATDLHTKEDWHEFDLLAELAAKLHAGIHILNAVQEEHVTVEEESRQGIKLEERLKNIPHSWHFPSDGDVVHAISKTARQISADWVAIVPHKRPWLKQLFHHSISNELAYNSNYPVLTLPEKAG